MLALWRWLTTKPDVANALAAIFSAVTALIALFVSVFGLWTQRRHDILSARPIPEVTVADYEDSLRIKLRNNGVGPLIVRTVTVRRSGVTETKGSVIGWMPPLPNHRRWTHFAKDLADRSLPPDGALPLLELTQVKGEDEFATCRDRVRRELQSLTVEVTYSDVYATVFPQYSKSLEWFGRNLQGRS
jgi:hypothetical protein